MIQMICFSSIHVIEFIKNKIISFNMQNQHNSFSKKDHLKNQIIYLKNPSTLILPTSDKITFILFSKSDTMNFQHN